MKLPWTGLKRSIAGLRSGWQFNREGNNVSSGSLIQLDSLHRSLLLKTDQVKFIIINNSNFDL
jgi:hypothetical protein